MLYLFNFRISSYLKNKLITINEIYQQKATEKENKETACYSQYTLKDIPQSLWLELVTLSREIANLWREKAILSHEINREEKSLSQTKKRLLNDTSQANPAQILKTTECNANFLLQAEGGVSSKENEASFKALDLHK